MSIPAKILLVEDDAAIAASLKRILSRSGYHAEVSARGDDGLTRAESEEFDLVITDFRLPGLNGLDLAAKLRASKPFLPAIVMTAHGTTETAIEAGKLGAYDYLLKPFEPEDLLELVRRAVATKHILRSTAEAEKPPGSQSAIVGQSRLMQNVYKEIGRIARSTLTVLIRGETGTGKELVARAIHQHSDRAHKPFIAMNCAAVPETLLESELFGHERGAFTGADTRRIGHFEQAQGGTIFLDEIGELSLTTQAKLLRVLQEKSIQRLGGKESVALDVRVVAATHRDLEAALAEKLFREDLYYRLNVVAIRIPPLRERREDIAQLVQYFLRRHSQEVGGAGISISSEAIALLQEWPWPGNVRELENVMHKAALASRGYPIDVEAVRKAITSSPAPHQTMHAYVAETVRAAARGEAIGVHRTILEAVEREICVQAMKEAGGNLTRAAKWLGITRVTMREKLAAFGLRSEPDSTV